MTNYKFVVFFLFKREERSFLSHCIIYMHDVSLITELERRRNFSKEITEKKLDSLDFKIRSDRNQDSDSGKISISIYVTMIYQLFLQTHH